MGVSPGEFPVSIVANCSGHLRRLALAATMALAPTVAPAELVINELLPDPTGSDGGHEFVELLNVGPETVSLAQVSLQFANGAVGADWTTRWQGTSADSVTTGSRFLLVDRNWLGPRPGDVEVYLGLQNGPDAIRLRRGIVVLDLVGYGPLTDSELFEGHPVPLVTGAALARRPDGRDTQDNRADFVATEPSPGASNFQPYSLALTELIWEPPHVPRPGVDLRISLTLRNDGTETLPSGPCRLVGPEGALPAWWDEAEPGAARTLVFGMRPLRRGRLPLSWEMAIPAQPDTIRLPLGAVQVGASDLRLNEVMPAPDHGQGEWIELQWVGPGSVNLDRYSLRDEDGGWVALPPLTLATGDLVVAAEDSAALVAWTAANRAAGDQGCSVVLEASGICRLSPWPALNNSAPNGRSHADRITLADSQGVVLDAVTWGGTAHVLPDRGVSLERIAAEPVNPDAANWMMSTAAVGSTPGCVNSVTGPTDGDRSTGALQVVPPLLDREAGPVTVHLRFRLVPGEQAWEMRVFNLWGDEVRDFGGDTRGLGPRDLVWDGRDDGGRAVGTGAYLVWLQTRSGQGLVRRREISRLVVR